MTQSVESQNIIRGRRAKQRRDGVIIKKKNWRHNQGRVDWSLTRANGWYRLLLVLVLVNQIESCLMILSGSALDAANSMGDKEPMVDMSQSDSPLGGIIIAPSTVKLGMISSFCARALVAGGSISLYIHKDRIGHQSKTRKNKEKDTR